MEDIWAPRVLSRLFPTGLVESYFLKINSPDGQRAAWLKYTFLKSHPVDGAVGECWAITFENAPNHPKVVGAKQSWDLAACRITADLTEIRIGDNLLAPGIATGSVQGLASWQLSFSPNRDPALLLPQSMYGDGVPFTRLSTPFARATVSGQIQFGTDTWQVERWPMTLGHNWGTKHSGGHVWGQMRGQSDFGEFYFEGFSLPIPIPGKTAITGGTLLLGHRTLSFSKPRSWWSNTSTQTPDRWQFQMHNSSHLLEGHIQWNPEQVAALRYVQPDGTVRWCRCSMMANGQLRLRPRFPGSSDLHFETSLDHQAALELLGGALPPGTRILA